MGIFLNLTFLTVGISSALFGLILLEPEWVFSVLKPLPPIKDVYPFEDHVWTLSGNPSPGKEIRPFKVDVSEDMLNDLKQRLKNTRYGPPIADVKFTYGFPSDQLRKVVDYWLHKYDWRQQEKVLNQYPQFLTNIEGLDIHFVHVKPANVEKSAKIKTYPIALFHGWPGSTFELYKLIPLLTKPRTFPHHDAVSFEVIIPAIPGFGFSQAAEKTGMEPGQIARIYDKLMQRLGHSKYFIYGGDWGSVFARSLAVMYPERILGMDLTLFRVPMFPTLFVKSLVAGVAPSLVTNPEELHKLPHKNLYKMVQAIGFSFLQSTKPDTVGAVLSDSPAGLAAYILEKFSGLTKDEFTNRTDGGLTEYFTMDDLLTNVMIYWITNSIQTSVRIYKENCGYLGCGNAAERTRFPVKVPTVLSDFRHEVPGMNPPSDFVKPYFEKLIKISFHPEGGHFSAMERPNELAEDIWTVLRSVISLQT